MFVHIFFKKNFSFVYILSELYEKYKNLPSSWNASKKKSEYG